MRGQGLGKKTDRAGGQSHDWLARNFKTYNDTSHIDLSSLIIVTKAKTGDHEPIPQDLLSPVQSMQQASNQSQRGAITLMVAAPNSKGQRMSSCFPNWTSLSISHSLPLGEVSRENQGFVFKLRCTLKKVEDIPSI